jgi:Ca2+:H+ antiporter
MTSLDSLRAAAADEAAAAGSGFVGSEHLFLAWLGLGTGPAFDAVTAAGLTAESFRAMLGTRRDSAKRAAGSGDGGVSSHAQRVLTSAQEIAAADGRDIATADDAFLAMIREPRGAVARALTDAKLKPSQLKSLIRPGPAAAPPPPRREAPRREAPARKPSPPAERAATPRPRGDPEIDDIPEPRAPERPRLVPPPKPARPIPSRRRWSPLWVLYLATPVSIWLHQTGSDPLLVFIAACLAIVPLAALISTATEHLAERTGPMFGALLNAAFGNATEVIVAIAALNAGYIELVKASLIGSILSNLLLILGLALLTGGLRQPILRFNRIAAGMSAAMLALAVAALMLPSLLHGTAADAHIMELSQVVAAILAFTYVASLVFTLRTHKRVFAAVGQTILDTRPWSARNAVVVLAMATAIVAVESQLLVDTIVPVTQSLHLTQAFLGLIVIPIVGNAAEHATAIVAARKGKTELALQIALGSSTQVALLVAPLLVLIGAFVGQGMDLAFPAFQVGALGVSVVVAAFITPDGESHWLEGVQLLALYAMIAAAAWFI